MSPLVTSHTNCGHNHFVCVGGGEPSQVTCFRDLRKPPQLGWKYKEVTEKSQSSKTSPSVRSLSHVDVVAGHLQ